MAPAFSKLKSDTKRASVLWAVAEETRLSEFPTLTNTRGLPRSARVSDLLSLLFGRDAHPGWRSQRKDRSVEHPADLVDSFRLAIGHPTMAAVPPAPQFHPFVLVTKPSHGGEQIRALVTEGEREAAVASIIGQLHTEGKLVTVSKITTRASCMQEGTCRI